MKKYLLLLFFAFVLAGCAQLPTPQDISWQKHRQALENLNHWAFTGKLAIITPQERHSLNIHWLQTGNNFHIWLTTFLGATVLDVQKKQFGTQITDHNGEIFWGDDAQSLINRLSGITLPINVLQQWIKGNPHHATYQLGDNNQVISLSGSAMKNAQWSVAYADYGNIQGINLPHKLQLTRLDLRLKFAISKWKIDPPSE